MRESVYRPGIWRLSSGGQVQIEIRLLPGYTHNWITRKRGSNGVMPEMWSTTTRGKAMRLLYLHEQAGLPWTYAEDGKAVNGS